MLHQKSPKLAEHLTKNVPDCHPEFYLQELFLCLFTRHLAVDEAMRLWDVYVFEGDTILIRAAVAFILTREMALLGTKTVDEVIQVLGNAAGSAVAAPGAEDRFMAAVREAGKV
jgi:hypothetical protein